MDDFLSSNFDFTGQPPYTPTADFDFTQTDSNQPPTLFGQAWPLYSTSPNPERITGQLWPLWG